MLTRKSDRGFLQEAQRRMADWNQLLDKVATTAKSPLRPQMVVRTLSDLVPDNAVISLDCGANTHFAARCLQLNDGHGHAGDDGPWAFVCHRREAGLSGSTLGGRSRGRRVRDVDGGTDDRRRQPAPTESLSSTISLLGWLNRE